MHISPLPFVLYFQCLIKIWVARFFSFYEAGRCFLRISLDDDDMTSGKDTSNSINRSPRWSGFFGNGSPYPIILLLIPGFTISLIDIGMFLPSIVGTLIEQPHSA